MILEKQSEGIVLEEGEVQESVNMEIDADSHIFLMRMLSKFYADAIGSLIRETASNALDSHRECGVSDPIVVSFNQNTDGNYEFSVEDFGCGMDDKDVTNIISKYGKSTKRQSVNQLGAFGLGFKSPLAYTSAFYFIGRKGGIERKWMLYEADDEQNKIDLLHEQPTVERNGVKVVVPVKWSDRSSFYSKIKEQLAYFENVYFDCGADIKNDFTIVRHEHFQWSPLYSGNTVHICLDNVFYPIDYTKLGISPISFPIALRFSLSDGIFPVPNREMIKYTQEAKDAIMQKLEVVADYFITKYNETVKDTEDVYAVFDYFRRSGRNIVGYNQKLWDVSVLSPFSKIKFVSPKLKGVELLDLNRIYHMSDSLLLEYDKKYEVRQYNGRFKTLDNSNWYKTFTFDQSKNSKIYTFSDINKQKKDYIRDTIAQDLYLVRKEREIKLGKKAGYTVRKPEDYIAILQLPKFPREEWRQRIKEFQYIQSLITSKFEDLDKLVIPQTWIDGRKKTKAQIAAIAPKTRRKKLEGEVTGKEARQLERFVSGKNCKFETCTIQMKDAEKDKKFTIYGGLPEGAIFDKLFTLFRASQVRIMIFSERELKRLKDVKLHNWMHMEEFAKGKHKIFRRAVTAYLIDKLEDDFPNVFRRMNVIEQVSTPLYEKLEGLRAYKRDHFLDGDEELLKTMLAVATETNLFDPIKYSEYKEVKFILEKLTFLNPLLNFGYYEDMNGPAVNALRDLFKYYKQRIDWKHYSLPINEEVKEVLEEELIN